MSYENEQKRLEEQQMIQRLWNRADWKKTRRKRSDAYVCFGPDIREYQANLLKALKTGVKNQGNPDKCIFYVLTEDDKAYAGQDANNLLFGSRNDGGSWTLYDGSALDRETLEKRAVACSLGGAMIPWMKITYSGDNATYLSAVFKDNLGCTVLVTRADNAGQPMIGAVQVLRELQFVSMYDLSAYPGVFNNVAVPMAEKPEDMFQPKEKVEELKISEMKDFATAIESKFAGVIACARKVESTGGYDVTLMVANNVVKLKYGAGDRELVTNRKVRKFTVKNGVGGAETDDVQLAGLSENGVFSISKLIEELK